MKTYDPIAEYTKPVSLHASLLSRTLAFILDISIISLTILAPVTTLAEQLIPKTDYHAVYAYITNNSGLSNVLSIIMVFVFILIILYFTLLEYLLGQTIGKKFLGLHVVTSEGKNILFWQALVRNCVLLPLMPFIFFWVVDPLYLLFTKRRLTEQLTKTQTVNYIKQVL